MQRNATDVFNNTQDIFRHDRGILIYILQNIKTSYYVCNRDPTDDRDALRCVGAVGRDLNFPLHVEIVAASTLEDGKE